MVDAFCQGNFGVVCAAVVHRCRERQPRVGATVNVTDARDAYATVLKTLRTERGRRQAFLKEPLRGIRLKEINDALNSLSMLGVVVGMAVDAGLLPADPAPATSTQAPLLDVPRTEYP